MDEIGERTVMKYCEFEVQGQLYTSELSGELACERVKRTVSSAKVHGPFCNNT
jgi:hypothetical protein